LQRWTLPETPRAGFYRVSEATSVATAAVESKNQAAPPASDVFAVNIDPSESEQLRWNSAVWPEGWVHTKLEGDDLPELAQSTASSENRLPQWILLAAVVLLFLELWLSGRTQRN
jgi:hypothetical protein